MKKITISTEISREQLNILAVFTPYHYAKHT